MEYDFINKKQPHVIEVMPGVTGDNRIKDVNNIGTAMAPAAADTFIQYFSASGLG